MEELIKQDASFKEEYIATRESIFIIGLSIVAFSAFLITLIIILL